MTKKDGTGHTANFYHVAAVPACEETLLTGTPFSSYPVARVVRPHAQCNKWPRLKADFKYAPVTFALIWILSTTLSDNTVVIRFPSAFPSSHSVLWTLVYDCCRLFHLTCSVLLFLNVWGPAQGSNHQLYPYLVLSHFGREETLIDSTAPKWMSPFSTASVQIFSC